tara:strand:+ start:13126 stop:13392 length:267 start_codon:yes stop_codon:yes gene_type:complete
MTRQKKKSSNVAVIVAISVVAAAAVAFGVWKVTRMKCKPLTGIGQNAEVVAQIRSMCNDRESEETCKAAKIQGTGNTEAVQACQWVRA